MRSSYDKAISFIRDHGHFAALTVEGVLATSWSAVPRSVEFCGDDVWFEETVVFGVDEDGNVDTSAIRDWLGY